MSSKKIRPLPDIVIIFLATLLAIYFLFPLLLKPSIENQPSSIAERQTNEFDNLLDKIKKDINQENIEIKVFLGPYFKYYGIVGMLIDDYRPKYTILFDIEFYNKLTPQEREAIVAHEAGHILFKYPENHSLETTIETQVLADRLAARYVNPDYVISALNKLYADYLTRKERLEQLKQVKP